MRTRRYTDRMGSPVAGLERCLVRYRPRQMILSYAEELMRDVIAPLMDLLLRAG